VIPDLEAHDDDKECSPRDGVSTPRLSSRGPPSDCICEDSQKEELSPNGSWLLADDAAESDPTIPESDDSSSHESSSSSDDEAVARDSEDGGEQVSDAEDLPKRGAKAPASNCNERVWVNGNTMS
jgi:hypothetical protein